MADKAAAVEKKGDEKKVKEGTSHRRSEAQPVRLYVKGVFVGFRRSRATQHENQALLRIEGLKSKDNVPFYLGKRVAYVYKAEKPKQGTRYRVIWGRIQRAHGATGTVRASFRTNLPSRAMGASVRVMLYPSQI